MTPGCMVPGLLARDQCLSLVHRRQHAGGVAAAAYRIPAPGGKHLHGQAVAALPPEGEAVYRFLADR